MKESVVASWSMHSYLDQAVWVWVLARDILLCSWARHFPLTPHLSTQVYKWVMANLMLLCFMLQNLVWAGHLAHMLAFFTYTPVPCTIGQTLYILAFKDHITLRVLRCVRLTWKSMSPSSSITGRTFVNWQSTENKANDNYFRHC